MLMVILWYGWPTKGVYPYFQWGLLSQILTIANIQQIANLNTLPSIISIQ